MATRMTVDGVSTCVVPGTERYEWFTMGRGRKKKAYVQYDFRDSTDGMLFSIVRPTLEECREERNVWLMKKTRQMD